MRFWRITVRSKLGKLPWLRRLAHGAAWTLGSLLALPIVLYLVALVDEHYEARRAVRVYRQLLTVRLGDTVAEFNRKAPGCKIGKADGDYQCFVFTQKHASRSIPITYERQVSAGFNDCRNLFRDHEVYPEFLRDSR